MKSDGKADSSQPPKSDALVHIPLDQIEKDQNQPRQSLGDLEDLKVSIRQLGLLQPIIVSPTRENRYRIVVGHRRFAAAKALELETISALVRSVQEQERLELQLIENLQRTDLNPVDEAESCKRLMDQFNLTQTELSARLGKSVAAINEALRILTLPDRILKDLRVWETASKSVLLEIAKQPDAKRQVEMWEKAKRGQLTVKKAREHRNIKRSTSYRVKIGNATVTVRFKKGSYGKEEIRKALKEAIEFV